MRQRGDAVGRRHGMAGMGRLLTAHWLLPPRTRTHMPAHALTLTMLLTARSLEVEHTATCTPLSIASSTGRQGWSRGGGGGDGRSSSTQASALQCTPRTHVPKLLQLCKTHGWEGQGSPRRPPPPPTPTRNTLRSLTDEALDARAQRQRPRVDQAVEQVGLELVQLFEERLAGGGVCRGVHSEQAAAAAVVTAGSGRSARVWMQASECRRRHAMRLLAVCSAVAWSFCPPPRS